jgi:putative endonuclease
MTKRRRPGEASASPPSPTEQQRLGRQGEDRALAYLQGQGLSLVDRNFRCKTGEIDLIMRDRDALVFVEVRRRNNQRFGGAAASVTAVKQAKLLSAAQVFLKRYANQPPCRFDVIAIEAGQIEWLKNAIEL